jgi:ubiquinone/menaquinone biosynthesis C-methylase UbiE
VGVDVSSTMLAKARAKYDGATIEFVLNETSVLRQFDNDRFAFV